MTVDILLEPLTKFYSNANNFKLFRLIINGDDDNKRISLRLVDWFVTNYCKKNGIIIDDNFNVYESYKANLRSYHKEKFDPFRRHNIVYIYHKSAGKATIVKDKAADDALETTIGQLNFFKWIISNNIHRYIIANRKKIEKDMITVQKSADNYTYKSVNGEIVKRKKRVELSKPAENKVRVSKNKVIVRFD
jgi:hypothetical protein